MVAKTHRLSAVAGGVSSRRTGSRAAISRNGVIRPLLSGGTADGECCGGPDVCLGECGGALVGEAFTRRSWGWAALWAATTVIGAVIAVLAEMTALQRWPVTRSKPVVSVLQTIVLASALPFFAATSLGVGGGSIFAEALVVVAFGSLAVGSSRAVMKAAS